MVGPGRLMVGHRPKWARLCACVLDVNSDNKEMKLTFLHAHCPSNSFNNAESLNTVN